MISNKKFDVLMGVWFAFVLSLTLGMLGFAIWVIVKVMQHFGVI